MRNLIGYDLFRHCISFYLCVSFKKGILSNEVSFLTLFFNSAFKYHLTAKESVDAL